LKGPIAHRVAFHYNLWLLRQKNRETEADGAQGAGLPPLSTGQDNPAVLALFGAVHEDATKGQAGRVYVDDIWFPEQLGDCLQCLDHTSIDRFTGGVRAGVLFRERVFYKGAGLKLRLAVEGFDQLEDGFRLALCEALRDLAEGRLALGAGGGRGHGYFTSEKSFDVLWASFTGDHADDTRSE
jgi:hypothetical protein